ncbi:MAG: hypothetical protein KAW56_13745 [Candidatus Marinimicrobia bacterium]|nr:hypothetical protein [Candidatus Neomarinimicrobiota bacterium]
MKKKYSLLVLSLILAMFLSGCVVGIIIPATDEAKVKNVINEYFLAINDQNWNKAKSYCIYGSNVYYETYNLEQQINDLILQYGFVIIYFFVNDISNISIHDGNYAEAYIDITLDISFGNISDSSDKVGYIYLEKIGNTWKIYDF